MLTAEKKKWNLSVTFEAVDLSEALDIIRTGECFPKDFTTAGFESAKIVGVSSYELTNGVTTLKFQDGPVNGTSSPQPVYPPGARNA